MAVSIPVKYIVTTKDALDNVPIIEGQVICLADQDGWYYDMGGERRETTGEKYKFVDSDTIEIIITPIEDNKFEWQAKVKEGSITEKELEGNYLSDIRKEADRAVRAANAAEAAAERSAASAAASAESAEESEDSAEESSQFASTANGYANDANGFAQAANNSANTATQQANRASDKATEAGGHARDAAASADESEDSATESKSWAVGGTSTRTGEDTNNAKYYAQVAQEAAQKLSGSLIPKGTILFEQLDDVQNPEMGWMFNIANDFTTDARFITKGLFQSAGTNIYYTASAKWDCMVGTNVTGVKGNAETNYRQGNVNITKADIGLDKVENIPPSEVIGKIIVRPKDNPGEEVGVIQINDKKYTFTSPNEIVFLTAAEYEMLSQEDKMKDLLYVITDDGVGSIIDDTVTSKYKTWSSYKIHQDVLQSATDEKMNVVKATTSKAYLIGTTTAPTTTEKGTKGVADPGVYLGTKAGELNVGSLNATGEIHASAVYSAVWNDFAEWFEKQNENETFEPGTIVAWDTDGVVKASEDNKYQVAGVCSNTYGYIVGGENFADMNENKKKFVPVALVGRVNVKVIGKVDKGDFIVPLDDGYGIAVKPYSYTHGTAVGKAIESKIDDEPGIVKIVVMLA